MTDQSTVIRFPRKRRRGSITGSLAQVFALPTSRHVRILEFISGEMQKQPTVDDADLYLVSHLNIEWRRLQGLGLTEFEIESQCREFARAAWRIAIKAFSQRDEGDVA